MLKEGSRRGGNEHVLSSGSDRIEGIPKKGERKRTWLGRGIREELLEKRKELDLGGYQEEGEKIHNMFGGGGKSRDYYRGCISALKKISISGKPTIS